MKSLAFSRWLSRLMQPLVLVALSALGLAFLGCQGTPTPPAAPATPITSLLLDQSVFPRGWSVSERTFDPEQRLPAEQVGVSFGLDGCATESLGGSHEVYWFWDGAAAAEDSFEYKVGVWFAPTEAWGPWGIPPELAYESWLADRYILACAAHRGEPVMTCQAVAQYGEYLARFHTSLDPSHAECMSFSDLERILAAIDERMALYLGQDAR